MTIRAGGHSSIQLIVSVALLAVAGCDEVGSPREIYVVDPSAQANAERRYGELHATVIAGGRSDTVLLSPDMIAATSEGIYVFDQASYEVVRLNDGGVVEARFGSQGRGPGEFQGVTHMQVGRDERLHILDVSNRRITVLSEELAQLDEIPLSSMKNQPYRALPIDAGYVLYTIATDSSLISISRTGEVQGKEPLPWRPIHGIHWMAREGFFVADRHSGLIVYAFIYGNGWLAFEFPTRQVSRTGRYLIDAPFPSVVVSREGGGMTYQFESRATPLIRGAALAHGCLFVVANDVGTDSESVVDLFQVRSSRYVQSYRVPFKITRLAVSDGIAYALGSNLYPIVIRAEIEGYEQLCDAT